MRVFVAVRPSEEAVAHLDSFLDVRRAAGAFRWTLADQLHLTLAFTPDLAEHRVDDAVDRLADAAARRTSFRAAVAGGGAFPDPDHGRVLYARLDLDQRSAAELERLAVAARQALGTSGAAVDGQRFRPHVTVARCGRPTNLTDWVRLLDAYRGPAWTVDRVVLVGSHLGEGPRRRPRHEELAEVRLA